MKFFDRDKRLRGEYVYAVFHFPASAVITMTNDSNGW